MRIKAYVSVLWNPFPYRMHSVAYNCCQCFENAVNGAGFSKISILLVEIMDDVAVCEKIKMFQEVKRK